MKRVALVTGGSRGIGLGIAKCLAKNGFDLAINGMRAEEDTADSLNELRCLGASVVYCRGDVGDQVQRQEILAKIKAEYGRLNVLVNNAGVAPKERKDILEASEESFDYVLKTNLNSAYFLSQAAANWMISQKAENPDFEGCLINVSSISATIASVNRGEYCIAKAGMSMATQLFAVRLGEYNIPVYEVRPGIIATDMTSGVKEKYDRLLANGLCVQSRWGLPEDVGLAVASLAKGDFPYSTGQVVMVDGGLSLPRL
ncbi:3-ketoacyl-ACP reductase [Lunatimonas lonarensis]|uniref:3-ketoacyl-ACP reductase n=1 Tax=Lunatimonas lonarensis TaxID=1232681 RepID=UPI0004B8EF0F|nr:3-ketoacyl-ACP reductase [Lunatimonas lonarensis]